jgi:hypothetical protein
MYFYYPVEAAGMLVATLLTVYFERLCNVSFFGFRWCFGGISAGSPSGRASRHIFFSTKAGN